MGSGPLFRQAPREKVMNLLACDFVVGGMLMYDRQRDVLECLVDGVLVRLIAIAETKAQSRHENRLTATQCAHVHESGHRFHECGHC